MGYVSDTQIAQDMVQETFIAVWQHLDSFRQESAVGTWIYRIATNICLRHIQIEKRYQKVDLPAQLKDNPFETEDNEAKLKQLRKCITALPEFDRLIIGLYLEEVPQEEIAEITGISHANIRVKVHRIKGKIAKNMRGNGQF